MILRSLLATCMFTICLTGSIVKAQSVAVTIDGPDAIFLAGRTDVSIPDPSVAWTGPGTHLLRHASTTPEEARETVPPMLPVVGGDVVRVLDPAVGGVNFFNGFGPPFFGPSGNTLAGSSMAALDGISGYRGPEGPLTGVFLDDSIPSSGPAPATLDFTPSGLTQEFTSLSPELGQVFFIGDGVTAGGVFQEFTAPAGATRLFLGIPDGFSFDGAPGAYDDNDGSYRVVVGINTIPEPPLLGDCNLDGTVNFSDISAFISILSAGAFLVEADINQDDTVDFLDISPFIGILSA